jgi:hypothetical protein
MRAMGGSVKPPARCCSNSHRICQMRPSMKPIPIATEIWKTITSTKVIIGISLPANASRLPDQRLPDRSLHSGFGKRSRGRGLITNAIGLRTLDRQRDAALTSLIPSLSCRSCPPNAPFAELVRLSRTSIADETREAYTRRTLG